MFRNNAIVLCISPVSFVMIPQPCHGLMEGSCHRFFLLLDRGAKPGNTWWCLTIEPNWSLYELCLLVKWNNPQILFFHMQNEILSEIQLSLGLHSEVTVPRSPRGFMHSAACGLTYDFFDIFFFWNNNKYFHHEMFGCREQVLMPCVCVLPEPLSWKLHTLNACSSTSGKCDD